MREREKKKRLCYTSYQIELLHKTVHLHQRIADRFETEIIDFQHIFKRLRHGGNVYRLLCRVAWFEQLIERFQSTSQWSLFLRLGEIKHRWHGEDGIQIWEGGFKPFPDRSQHIHVQLVAAILPMALAGPSVRFHHVRGAAKHAQQPLHAGPVIWVALETLFEIQLRYLQMARLQCHARQPGHGVHIRLVEIHRLHEKLDGEPVVALLFVDQPNVAVAVVLHRKQFAVRLGGGDLERYKWGVLCFESVSKRLRTPGGSYIVDDLSVQQLQQQLQRILLLVLIFHLQGAHILRDGNGFLEGEESYTEGDAEDAGGSTPAAGSVNKRCTSPTSASFVTINSVSNPLLSSSDSSSFSAEIRIISK